MSQRETEIRERRSQTAAALLEYRRFVRDHPDDELASMLQHSIDAMRGRLRERRNVLRQIGWAHLEKAHP